MKAHELMDQLSHMDPETDVYLVDLSGKSGGHPGLVDDVEMGHWSLDECEPVADGFAKEGESVVPAVLLWGDSCGKSD
jgi:hypothetical protein